MNTVTNNDLSLTTNTYAETNKEEAFTTTKNEDKLLATVNDNTISSSGPSAITSYKKKRLCGKNAKKGFRRAQFILAKIKKNEAEGKTHERDAEDKIKYQKIFDDYNSVKSYVQTTTEIPITKREQSKDETAEASAKRSKIAESSNKSNIQLVVIDELAPKKTLSAEKWKLLENKLTMLIMDYVMDVEEGKPLPGLCSSGLIRGYRVMKCDNEFSVNFLKKSIDKINIEWKEIKLDLISVERISNGPRARIWLPQLTVESGTLLKCLQRLNTNIPMHNWSIIKNEELEGCSQPCLVLINEESLQPLKECEYRLRFGVRYARVKVLEGNDDIEAASGELVDASLANQLQIDQKHLNVC